jgi:hypothetical protein
MKNYLVILANYLESKHSLKAEAMVNFKHHLDPYTAEVDGTIYKVHLTLEQKEDIEKKLARREMRLDGHNGWWQVAFIVDESQYDF